MATRYLPGEISEIGGSDIDSDTSLQSWRDSEGEGYWDTSEEEEEDIAPPSVIPRNRAQPAGDTNPEEG